MTLCGDVRSAGLVLTGAYLTKKTTQENLAFVQILRRLQLLRFFPVTFADTLRFSTSRPGSARQRGLSPEGPGKWVTASQLRSSLVTYGFAGILTATCRATRRALTLPPNRPLRRFPSLFDTRAATTAGLCIGG